MIRWENERDPAPLTSEDGRIVYTETKTQEEATTRLREFAKERGVVANGIFAVRMEDESIDEDRYKIIG